MFTTQHNRRQMLQSLGALGLLPALGLRGSMMTGPQSHSLSNGFNAFGWDLFRKLGGANPFLSPTSIALALAMTERGARGETRNQMRKVLRLPESDSPTDPGFGPLLANLVATKEGRQISMANRLFGQKGYGFQAEFLAQVRDWFQAPMEEVDFIQNTEGARQTINDWVEKETKSKIKDLVPPNVLTRLTRLVLANAIHFKGLWLTPFTKDATRPAPFETAPGSAKQLPRMSQKKRFAIRETDEVECLEMPCKGSDRSVHFLLPKRRHGLDAVIQNLDGESLANKLLFSEARAEEVSLGLPKFKIESANTLNQPLADLGMPDAFSRTKANFMGISESRDPMQIDAVLHKAALVIDELGAEAAAATAVVVGVRSAIPRPPRVFTVDQPFLVAITDTPSRAILFLGKISDPMQA